MSRRLKLYILSCSISSAVCHEETEAFSRDIHLLLLSIEDVWVIPLLRGEKTTTRLSLKYAKLSVKLFYGHYRANLLIKKEYCNNITRNKIKYSPPK